MSCCCNSPILWKIRPADRTVIYRMHTHGHISPRFYLRSLIPARCCPWWKVRPVDCTTLADKTVCVIFPLTEFAAAVAFTAHLIEKGVWRRKPWLIWFPVQIVVWWPTWR